MEFEAVYGSYTGLLIGAISTFLTFEFLYELRFDCGSLSKGISSSNFEGLGLLELSRFGCYFDLSLLIISWVDAEKPLDAIVEVSASFLEVWSSSTLLFFDTGALSAK